MTITGTNCNNTGGPAIIYFGPKSSASTSGSTELGRFPVDGTGQFQATVTVPATLNPVQGLGGGLVGSGPYRVFSAPSGLCETDVMVSTYQPGPAMTEGAVIGRAAGSITITGPQDGQRVTVDLGGVRQVWKETIVSSDAIEIGDVVTVNGVGGRAGAFSAAYVWVNIGRRDGVIVAVDATGLTIVSDGRSGSRTERIEFSPYLEVVRLSDGAEGTTADLIVGRSIGAVIYQPPQGPPHATTIWWSP